MWHAHSLKDRPQDDWEALNDHLQAVALRAHEFATAFGAGGCGRLLGLLHDLGKYDPRFQCRLKGDRARFDHAAAGAIVARETYGRLGRLLAYALAGHHAGLADGRRGQKTSARSSLDERLAGPERAAAARKALERARADGIALAEPALIDLGRGEPPLCGLRAMLMGRMLFSALVDADFLETERFYAKAERRTVERGNPVSLVDLHRALSAFLDEKQRTAKPTDVNRLRNDVLAAVRSKARERPGVFTLTVPTGGGKTFASLAFALEHALEHKLARVIVVIPYTSIIEQTAQEYRKALAPHRAAVVEHHSAFDESKLDPNAPREGPKKLRLAEENWDAAVVVTTAVQFFESLFADRPSRCRKLHNIARSVVILDEAQVLPLGLLRPCIAVLDELARNYGTSIVVCTATLPAVRRTDDPQRSFRFGLTDARELAPDPADLFRRLARVRIEHVGKLSDAELAERLAKAPQALCIVNTRRHARRLFDRIKDRPGARHLSTLMCGAHRR